MDEERLATRAYVLHPDIRADHSARAPERALEEAVALAHALPELDVAGAQVVPLRQVNPGRLFGKGKLAEIGALLKEKDVGLVLVDGVVSPVQQRNLEEDWGVKLLDRTGLILEIFSDRARTREGVLQVEMAALSYQRTRLVRAWTHLERQRGGLGFVGGPGETQVEADRRAIDLQIGKLKQQLAKVIKTRSLHRKARKKIPFPIVALVGYTNAGKSTLFNRLTGAKVFAKDMLFATLDPTMRKVELPSGTEVIMSDTVGFISELPTELVAAFRATLEEVLDADLIVHVRDISHPESSIQASDVEAIMSSLGVDEDRPKIELWNKIDLLSGEERDAVEARAARSEDAFAVSSLTGFGLDEVLEVITARVTPATVIAEFTLPFAEGRKRAWLFEQGVIENEVATEDGYKITVCWSQRQTEQFAAL